ncbi:MAG: hypothetical protein IMW89_19360 [Ktedonobacteraceae bacterium]|nr:hypothetical protein [Ktedonobacteraceae bacterium]
METCRQVRQWKRAQAVLLLAQGLLPEQVAMVLQLQPSLSLPLGCPAAWKRQGSVVLSEESPAGRPAERDPKARDLLEHWLEEGTPQQQGEAASTWTVPLLQTQLSQSGSQVSQRTIRRAWPQLGWRWKRPKDVPLRPDPADAQNKLH